MTPASSAGRAKANGWPFSRTRQAIRSASSSVEPPDRIEETLKIATWNINGVRARLGNLISWLKDSAPDIVCLQEIKSADDQFPRAEVETLGYHVETHGQKGFNGVAILSKLRFDEVNRGLMGDDADEQA